MLWPRSIPILRLPLDRGEDPFERRRLLESTPRFIAPLSTQGILSADMKLFSVLGAALGLASLVGPALGMPASAPHAAACVAALKAQESSLAEQLKTGAPVESLLLTVVRSGIAIIGTQYLAGLHEAEARQLLKVAEDDFRAVPPEEAEARQAECLREGEALYEQASPLERSLITTAAHRRIKRMMDA